MTEAAASSSRRRVRVAGTSRRRFLIGGAALAAGGLGYGFGVEPRWLDVRSVRVGLSRRLERPVRILHLADLHRSRVVGLALIDRAARRGLQRAPDLICLTGDYVTAGDAVSLDGYAETLSALSARAPTFAVLGNHDGGEWSAARGGETTLTRVSGVLRDAGIEVLHNRSLTVEIGAARVQLVGLADLWSGRCDPRAAFAGARSSVPTLVLAHNPDAKDVVADADWDLMLAGHTHGGQVVVPLVGPPVVTVRDRRYVAGLNAWRRRQIYTTRGVGNLMGVRFNCRPEVTLLDVA